MAKAKKRKKYKVNKVRGIAVLALVLFVGLLCFCLFSPIFNITAIEISGNSMVSTTEITERTAYLMGDNIFRVSSGGVSKTLRPLAYLDTVTIKRKLPSTLEICVTECSTELMFPHMAAYLLTDANAKVLEEISDPTGWELPLIYGVEIAEGEISENIVAQDEVKFDIIMNFIQYLKEKSHFSDVRSVDFTDITNIWVTYKDGYRVNFAKFEEMDYKMKMLEMILPQVDRSEGTYIDLTTPSQVFTGKIEAPETPAPETEENATEAQEGTEPLTNEKENTENAENIPQE